MSHKKLFLIFVSGLYLTALLLGGTQIQAVQASTEVDLVIYLKAPKHVAPASSPVINLSYSNIGTAAAPDLSIFVTLPEGQSFVSAVDQQGKDLPPDEISDNLVIWSFGGDLPPADLERIRITTLVDADLTKGTPLPTHAQIATSAVEPNTENNEAFVTSIVRDSGRH